MSAEVRHFYLGGLGLAPAALSVFLRDGWCLTRHDSDLLQEAYQILFCPFFNKLAISKAVDRDRSHSQIIAGARSSWKIALMLTVGGKARDNLVAFGNLIF